MSNLIDRRLNDRRKSSVNRERFVRRYKEHVRRAVDEAVSSKSLKDLERGEGVSVPVKDLREPGFRHASGGEREYVLPGNRKFMPGEKLPRPDGGGQGNAGGGPGQGDSVDEFAFTLSREEFLALFLDDLELPRMVKNSVGGVRDWKSQPAGYTRSGPPRNLHIVRSLKQSLARRIAQKSSAAHVPFLDEIDLRYRLRTRVPQPVSQAVMFCLMDVSGSMDEARKDLAKRFYTLLYLFLTRKYEKVEVVFIRHTDDAEEVGEEEFFHGRQSGGTVVMSALELMRDIVAERYPPSEWNVYGAQASDGDAFGADPERSRDFLQKELLPLARYFAYIEVGVAGNGYGYMPGSGSSTLWQTYQRIGEAQFAMRHVSGRGEIYPVFRDLFRREAQ